MKVHAKDELHQLDELKPNQRAHLEHLLGQHWDLRGDTFPRPGDAYSLAGEDVSRSEETVLFPPHWDHNFTRLLGTEEQIETQENVGMKNDEVFKDNARPPAGNVDVEAKTKLGEDGFNSTEGNPKVGHKHTQPHSPLGSDDKSKPFKSHTAGLSKGVAENSRAMLNPSEETIERARSRVRPTKEPNPEPREAAGRRENETPDVERMSQIAEEKLEAERKELLLLHKRLDEEKELLRQQKMKQEEEESPKEKETDSQHLQHRKHHHLHTTTPKPGKRIKEAQSRILGQTIHYLNLHNSERNQSGFFALYFQSHRDNNIHNYHAESTGPDRPQAPGSSKPSEKKNEEESQTDQQGSNESDAHVGLK